MAFGMRRFSAKNIAKAIKGNWFLLGIVIVIFLAYLAPWIGCKDGPLVPRITVKILAVSFIFFSSGLTLESEALGRSILQVKVHAFVQLYTFIAIPLVTKFAIVPFLAGFTSLSPFLLQGFMILGCMPPPVSSAAILTRAAEGNEAAAIFNSAFGSFLGIIVTPMLLLYMVGIESSVPVMNIFISLASTVVLPLIVGQIMRKFMWDRIRPLNIPFKQMAQCVLLLIIYSAFCDTFQAEFDVDGKSLTLVIGVVVTSLAFFTTVAYLGSKKFKYSGRDVVAITYCGTHKSLTLGMPMLKIIFEGNPNLSLISLPLLLYHPTQIMLGGLLVPFIRKWTAPQVEPTLPFSVKPSSLERRMSSSSNIRRESGSHGNSRDPSPLPQPTLKRSTSSMKDLNKKLFFESPQ